MTSTQLWNANIHYHSLLVEALDLDGHVLERAKTRHAGVMVEWQQGDLFDVPLDTGSFDAVVSVATLHHVPAEAALARFADLVKPGGVVAIVGLAANDWWKWEVLRLA